MGKTSIQWTDETWNPVRGCTKVSPGCKHCYAEAFAERFRGVKGHPYEQGFDLRLVPEKLTEPLRWREPRRVFVNSMSDLFHEDVPDEYIEKVFAVMANAPGHTFQILTKRAERMLRWFEMPTRYMNTRGTAFRMYQNGLLSFRMRQQPDLACDNFTWPLPNVWLGISAEDQERFNERVGYLCKTDAAIRFISFEPLLGAIDTRPWLYGPAPIRWAIIGGESGGHPRAMNLAWARSLLKQCRDAGVAPFLKQLGARAEEEAEGFWGNGLFTLKLKHKKGGDIAEWPPDLQVREYPATA